jgi:hypothetical protein
VSRSQTPSIAPTAPTALEASDASTKLEILIEKLDFDQDLTTQDQAAGVRVYYQCYEAVLAAQKKFGKLHKAGKWDASFHPTQDNFIALITSHSMWYNFYKKNFDKLSHYEVMREWLLETSEATNLEIWGFERMLYQ